jgi:predicted nucleic acid-binding protein
MDLWVGALQRAEIVFFMRAHEEKLTLAFLCRFKTADATQTIVDLGAALYRRWHKTNGTDVNDALLAATAVKTHRRIVTLNVKHYPMPDISVTRAWG